jgi:hypothetical protein
MTYYKFLTENNKGSFSGFDYTDYLPKNGKPGKWLPLIEDLEMCETGYHACKKADVLEWLNAQMFEVELRGETIVGDNKVVAQQMRYVKKIVKWNDKNARLAACDIAEQIAMKIWNKKHPDDKRPQNAIDTARKFAHGKATRDELDAAGDAAGAAAGDAAWDAAWDAARDAAGAAARDAAGDAAWAAARDAAWDAARAAARAAAREHFNQLVYECFEAWL